MSKPYRIVAQRNMQKVNCELLEVRKMADTSRIFDGSLN